MKHNFARTALAVAALAAIGIAGCGGDDETATATATATQTQATATATQTQTQTQATQTQTAPEQREAVVPGKEATLQTGDETGLTVKVDKVLDPAAAAVDRAQPGNKLVGVFVTGQSKGVIEATRTTVFTTLETTDGDVKGIRVIADGDCAGGFSAHELLSAVKKPASGCIGFEIPKKATPKAITIVLTSPKGTKQATWKLPKAK